MNGSPYRRAALLKPSALRTIPGVLLGWALLFFAGCAPVGPDYRPPDGPVPGAWHAEMRQGLAAKETDLQVLARWWTVLDDPVLTGLIDSAIANNLDLREAGARVREARARRGISRAGEFPVLEASGRATRSRSSENSGSGATGNFYALGFDAGWEIDIFGGLRRAVEAADADLEASRENLRDVLVSLTAEVALNYLDVRTFQSRLTVAEANLKIQRETCDLIDSRYQAGLGDELALQQARYNLESTAAQIPSLRSSLEGAKNRLAVLTARIPGTVHGLLEERKALPVPPPEIAVGLPAEALRRRPDIRGAERELAAQTARIGVAAADLYPKFRLAGSIGLESLKSAKLFESASRTWSLGPSASWNLFDAGAIRSNIEVQSALEEQFLLRYETAVLTALEEVENALTAYAEEQLRRERLLAAVDAARQAQTLAEAQYGTGLTEFNTVLEAQRALLSFEDQLTQSNGTVVSNLIRLYKAMGGGWVAEPAFPATDHAEKRISGNEQ